MFTGIIEAVGRLDAIEKRSGGRRLTIDVSGLVPRGSGRGIAPLALGDSLAVSGPCLTAAAVNANLVSFDAVAETVARTTMESWRPGRAVNLERAVAAGASMGGHFVTGHVDGRSRVLAVRHSGQGVEIDFSIPDGCGPLVAEKGSVALDGVSLTVARLLSENSFRVAVVPHTMTATTLGNLKPGDEINFEADILARYAARLMGAAPGGGALTEEKLRRAGFI